MPVQFFTNRNQKGELELITEFSSGRSYATIIGKETLTLKFEKGHLVGVRRG
ncbi:MAG: hypothetical protein HGA71_08460 [Azonexaceae bacterium]|nr:hypothetical protein [Azonexaceae bacterium]